MEFWDIFLLALGVSTDSFCFALCFGAKKHNNYFKFALNTSIIFSSFQFLMPLLGIVLGKTFNHFVCFFDRYIIFSILIFFGTKSIIQSFKTNQIENNLSYGKIITIAFFSSFDSLGIGISLSYFAQNIFVASLLIITFSTFFLTMFGTFLGKKISTKNQSLFNIFSGLALIFLAIKFLIK